MEENAQALTRLALEMQKLCTTLQAPDGTHVVMRVGLHCGPLVGGLAGGSMLRYHLFGSPMDAVTQVSTLRANDQDFRRSFCSFDVDSNACSSLFFSLQLEQACTPGLVRASAAFCRVLLPDDPRWDDNSAAAAGEIWGAPTTAASADHADLGSPDGSVALNDSSLRLGGASGPERQRQRRPSLVKLRRGSLTEARTPSATDTAQQDSGAENGSPPDAPPSVAPSFFGGWWNGAGGPLSNSVTPVPAVRRLSLEGATSSSIAFSAPRRASLDGAPPLLPGIARPLLPPPMLLAPLRLMAEDAGPLTLAGAGLSHTFHIREFEPVLEV